MPTLSDVQKQALANSIRTQYKFAGNFRKDGKYIPAKVAVARGLRLVLNKRPEAASNRAAKTARASANKEKAAGQKETKTKLKQQQRKQMTLDREERSLADFERRLQDNDYTVSKGSRTFLLSQIDKQKKLVTKARAALDKK